MRRNKKNEFDYLESFVGYTDYFLSCEDNQANFDEEKCNIIFIKIFNSILFENDDKMKNKKVAYLVFWLNFVIEFTKRKIIEPLLTTVITIIDKLDLQQLIKYTSESMSFDFRSELNYELRKVLDKDIALTDSQIDMLLAILSKKDIIVSAPTSYGKTGTVLKALLVSVEKGYINNFVVILPTKSLINEYRKNINKYFNEKNEKPVVTESPYVNPDASRTIFLFTQERFLIFNNAFNDYKFEYVILDEVQDLANVVKASENERSVLLAKAVSIVAMKKVPMVFLMPYINEPYESFISKFVTLDNNRLVVIDKLFSPTSSIKYLICKENDEFNLFDVTYNRGYFTIPQKIQLDITNINNESTFDSVKYDLHKICAAPEIDSLNEKSLYFCKKSEISETARLFSQNIEEKKVVNNRRDALIRYLTDYIGDNFELIDFIKKGVCIHTGDLDAFTKRQIETIFLDDESSVNHIFCTTTLLKGVNLNANNLFFLAPKGQFDNAELDKKNLLGRVGRLGSCLQGRIFRFYVESRAIKFDTIKTELNASSEPCEFSAKKFDLPPENKRTKALNTYIADKDVDNSFTKNIQEKINALNCFDYFIGHDESARIQGKFNNKSETEIKEIVEALKLSNYECYKKLVVILADIYEWEKSADFEISRRMINVDFTTRLFYNVAIGTTIKRFVKNDFEINEKNGNKPYVVTYRNKKEVWFLSNEDRIDFEGTIRPYADADINILIYTTLRDVSNLIEYRLKIFLQDLYYRLGNITGERLHDIESFLTHSLVGNKRKIALKNIGIVDDFAINILCEQSQLFNNEDAPQVDRIVSFANNLTHNDPIKYAIKDVFGD